MVSGSVRHWSPRLSLTLDIEYLLMLYHCLTVFLMTYRSLVTVGPVYPLTFQFDRRFFNPEPTTVTLSVVAGVPRPSGRL